MWNLCGPWEFKDKTVSEKFFIYSEAYLNSAGSLCDLIASSPNKQSYANGVVILYLTFHAVELFLKAAVLTKSPNEPLNHKIEKYQNRYNKLYPAKRFKLEIPFKTEDLDIEKYETAQIDIKLPPQDQVNRYPVDKEGKEWNQPFAFEPYSFQKDINKLKENFRSIRQEINAG